MIPSAAVTGRIKSTLTRTIKERQEGQRTLRYRNLSWLILLALVFSFPGSAWPQDLENSSPSANPEGIHHLSLAGVELHGATRTSLNTVFRFLPLQPGDPIDQSTLVEAVAELRQGRLFKSVTFYTRPGLAKGQLVLVLEVEEHGLDFRWAAGNTDIDGWYLVPAMLAYDNAFGNGGMLDLQIRLGFRHGGYLLRYGQPRAGDGRVFWGGKLSAISTDWLYVESGTTFVHEVKTAGLTTILGRRSGSNRLFEFGLKLESVDVADHSTVLFDSIDSLLVQGTTVSKKDLPLAIQGAVGKSFRSVFHTDWQYDSRAKELKAGTPITGIWGRLKGQLFLGKDSSYPGFQADLRAYRHIPGGVLAGRVRGSWVGNRAPFYDRLYLGGMYTVRGFPTNSLSAPGGDTWLFSSSLEYRSRILGDQRGTKLAGVLFLDAGVSGASDSEDPYHGVAAGVGYGLRLRVWWLGWVGLDVGFPLTERPLNYRFNATASIGWSF